jgi:Fe2+ transport system protein B
MGFGNWQMGHAFFPGWVMREWIRRVKQNGRF